MTAAAWTRRLAVALLAASVVAASAGCSVRADPHVPGSWPGTARAASGMPVVLRFGDHAVAATLTDTPPARQFAAMLPVNVRLKDAWGQAKSGRLPHLLTAEGGTPVHDPTPGGIYVWPPSGVIAIYYDDLGQAVPGPGLVRLGFIEAGLDRLADAGNGVTVRIESAAATDS
ncbi:cyclophilin-like fold protein [Nonomuraea guangzhouensis]|uniref:Cyclophilin-like fold protein n=1 Tax=Nonomuraea guangzhouensis TaxID=1291555 RepID=A0ABW4G877_9ACTN|nr:cyclophilin-like fold protein [Nonomuraea guangzhouensis]